MSRTFQTTILFLHSGHFFKTESLCLCSIAIIISYCSNCLLSMLSGVFLRYCIASSDIKYCLASFVILFVIFVPAESTSKSGLSFLRSASHIGLRYPLPVHTNNTLNLQYSFFILSVFILGAGFLFALFIVHSVARAKQKTTASRRCSLPTHKYLSFELLLAVQLRMLI